MVPFGVVASPLVVVWTWTCGARCRTFQREKKINQDRTPHDSGQLAWGTWGTGGFDERGLLFQRGHRLGTQTNNVAEVRGLAFAAKAMLHWHFWFVEECARIAASEAHGA